MNVSDVTKFDTTDAVKFHSRLNPKLWTKDHKLKENVRDKLLRIAEDFKMFLGIKDLDVKDVTISGSNAAYSYTPHSDLDVHLLVDMSKLPDDDVYRELFSAKKMLYNDGHNITIYEIPVEMYVQDSNEPVNSLGEYSLLSDSWIRFPKKSKANFDQNATKNKYDNLSGLIELALNTHSIEKIDKTLQTIRRYRQAGLNKGGEFGPENVAFKMLRARGYIDVLYDARTKLKNTQLSIEEQQLLNEIELGGYLETDELDKIRKDNFTNPQLDLFTQKPSKTPNLPHGYVQLGMLGDYAVLQNTQYSYGVELVLIDRNVPIGYLKLSKLHHHSLPAARWLQNNLTGVGYSSTEIYIDSKYRGQRLAMSLYHWALTHVCDYIVADSTHTWKGAALWKNMLNSKKFVVNVYDPNKEISRKRWAGKDFDQVYNVDDLIPWVTIPKKYHSVIGNGEDVLEEGASGYIPSKKEASDPRYCMALTKDIGPDAIQQNAKRLGWKISRAGIPPLLPYGNKKKLEEGSVLTVDGQRTEIPSGPYSSRRVVTTTGKPGTRRIVSTLPSDIKSYSTYKPKSTYQKDTIYPNLYFRSGTTSLEKEKVRGYYAKAKNLLSKFGLSWLLTEVPFDYNPDHRSSGTYYYDTDTLVMSESPFSTLIHELGHRFHYKCRNTNELNDEIDRVYNWYLNNKSNGFARSYSRTDRYEFWADSFASYIMGTNQHIPQLDWVGEMIRKHNR